MGRIGTLLNNSEKRKIVMVMSREAFNNMTRIGHGGLTTNPNITIIKYDDLTGRQPDSSHFLQHNVLPDEILIQSPFDEDIYIPATEALYSFSIAKHHLVSELYQFLGCTHLEISQIDIIGEKATRLMKLQINHPAVSVSGSAATIDELSICSGFELFEDYSGSVMDVASANSFLTQNGLSGDNDLVSLIRKRNNSINKLKNHSIKVTLTSESRRSLDIITAVSVPPLSANLDAAFQRIKETRREYRVTYQALFC
jgi:hypothetical protein